MNKNIISLTGLSGAGKSTIASILEKEKGYHIKSWCSELRRRVAIKCGLTDVPEQYLRVYPWDEIIPDKEWEHRSGFHQLLLDEPIEKKLDAFAYSCINILRLIKERKQIVIPDTRFPREYEFLKDLRATKICVYSSRKETNKQPFDELLERYPFDIFVKNNGGIDDLREAMLWYVSQPTDS